MTEVKLKSDNIKKAALKYRTVKGKAHNAPYLKCKIISDFNIDPPKSIY